MPDESVTNERDDWRNVVSGGWFAGDVSASMVVTTRLAA